MARRRFVVRHPVVVDIGGCCCRKPKLRAFFSNLLSKLKLSKLNFFVRLSNYLADARGHLTPSRVAVVYGNQKVQGVEVDKESADPYIDFRDSMLEMIIEMEIYAWDDLRDLIHRFLALNQPCHYQYILQAYYDIWTEVFSPSASTPGRRW